MKDFTPKQYKLLLNALLHRGYSFQSFSQNIIEKKNPILVTDHPLLLLRHDVEARYEQALKFAQIQNEWGIKGTYFFRLLPKSFRPEIVNQIADLGHEIGYHYDDLAQCKGDYKKAIERFQKNLETLREIAPVQTICMDGSPLSKYDNKELWKKYNYQDFGIIGEPYLDIDFNTVFYLTDTGRCWNGSKFSVRDKVLKEQAQEFPSYRMTSDIITAIEKGSYPKQAMITFHPQRWNDAFLPWLKELLWQNVKNQVKRFLVKKGQRD